MANGATLGSMNTRQRLVWATFPIAALCGICAGICQLLCPYIGFFCLFPLVLIFIAECFVINIETRMKLFTDESRRQRFLGKWRHIAERGHMPFNARKLLNTSLHTARTMSYVLNILAVLMVLITIGVGGCVYWLATWEQTFTTPFVFDWCVNAALPLYLASCVFAVAFGVLAWITAVRYRKASKSTLVQQVLDSEN